MNGPTESVVTRRLKYQTGDTNFQAKCPRCGEKNGLMWHEAGKQYVMTGWCDHFLGARPCGFDDFQRAIVRVPRNTQGIVETGQGADVQWAEVEMVFKGKTI